MARSSEALQKGQLAELLAKAFFIKEGLFTFTPDTHEQAYDFLVTEDHIKFVRVQVKCSVKATVGPYTYTRFRNKHGSTNKSYEVGDYDVLAGIDLDTRKIYLFKSEEVNSRKYGECISVTTTRDGGLSVRDRYQPYFIGEV